MTGLNGGITRDHWWWRPGWREGRSFYTWHVTFSSDETVHEAVSTYKSALDRIGTLDPVEVEDLTKHKMHSEYFEISTTAAETINKTIKSKGNVLAVGASVVRALESSVLTVGTVKPNRASTDKCI